MGRTYFSPIVHSPPYRYGGRKNFSAAKEQINPFISLYLTFI
jgi:hypothetical protein